MRENRRIERLVFLRKRHAHIKTNAWTAGVFRKAKALRTEILNLERKVGIADGERDKGRIWPKSISVAASKKEKTTSAKVKTASAGAK